MSTKPKVNSEGQREIEKAAKQFDAFEDNVKEMTMDRMSGAKKEEVEPQTKLSQSQIEKSKDIYLKPEKSIGCGAKEKFNERFRESYNFDKEYVQFIAENKEVIGETIEIWTKPYGGMPAEYWKVPTNKPIWGPRYLAEQIKRKNYHRLKSEQSTIVSADGMGTYHGGIVVDTLVQRLDALPVSTKKSVFMGASGF
jgi:hypothetical protein